MAEVIEGTVVDREVIELNPRTGDEIVRDRMGRFVSGTGGGPGRPTKKREEAYLRLFAEVVTLDVARELIQQAVDDALEGKSRAREWIFKHLIGPPEKIWERKRLAEVAESIGAVDVGLTVAKIRTLVAQELTLVEDGDGRE